MTSDQALIEYVFLDSTNHKLAVFYITQKEFQTKFIGSDQLNNALKKYMDTMLSKDDARNETLIQDLGQKLYQLILEPLNPTKEELIIIPDGELFQLPFEAISPDGKNYLITKHMITYAPSVSIALRSHEDYNYEYEYIGFAPKFSHLKYSVKEIQHSAEFFPYFYRKTFVNNQATIENFRGMPSTRVLHFSTHSMTVDVFDILSKKQKGITLQDDILFKKLIPETTTTDLTFLSVCGGIEDIKYVPGEGYQSLMYIFLPHANFIIYPLFGIHDAASYNLAGVFFKHVNEGLSYKKALHQAKLDLLGLEGAAPLFWSGLVITH